MKKRTTRIESGKRGIAAGISAGIFRQLLTPLWLVPALAINLDWSESASLPWNLAAAGSIAATAVIFEAARHERNRLVLAGLVLLGMILLCANVANGFRNAVTRSGDASDHRRGDIEAAALASQTRARLNAAREEAVAIVGVAPAARFNADIESRKASDAPRWRATRGCDPAHITLPASQAYCVGIATLQGKLEAAQRREQIDEQLAVLDLRREKAPTPRASADPFADAAAGVLGSVGFAVAPAWVRTFFDGVWAVIPELLAAFMPAVMLGRIDRQPQPPRAPAIQVTAIPKQQEHADSAPTTDEADPFLRFVAEILEIAPGERTKAGEAYAAYERWCAAQARQPETNQWFGRRMGKAFAFNDRNKRKVYLGVRLRRQSHLRLISAA